MITEEKRREEKRREEKRREKKNNNVCLIKIVLYTNTREFLPYFL